MPWRDLIPPDAPTSRCDEAAAGWYGPNRMPPHGRWVADLEGRRSAKWDTLSWTTLRTLSESLNDVLARRAPTIVRDRRRRYVAAQRAAGAERADHGPPTPGHGSFAPDFLIDWTGRSRPRFLIVGDPGEADASQYAVIEPLERLHAGGAAWEHKRRESSDFLVVLSDVIYPAGDVNDYPNGFYLPFRNYDGPVYAIPGNHDWYDGLSGFMFHFCHAEPLPRTNLSGRGQLSDRIVRALWRRASRPRRDLLAPFIAHRSEQNLRRAGNSLPAPDGRLHPVQPSPYFAIEMEELVIVGIDTGVEGELDAEQARWLLRISANSKPKVLLTGKPIWANGEHRPGAITWDDSGDTGPAGFVTVDDVVRHESHHYVAAIGGDTHNYQRYPVRVRGRTIQYIVSGGGGAYLAATHAIPLMKPGAPCDEADFRCYPLRGDSFALFCRRMGPLLFKSLITTLLIVGSACALLFGIVDIDPYRRRAAEAAALGFCVLTLLIALFVFLTLRFRALRGRGQGFVVVLIGVAAAVGILLAFADERATVAAMVAIGTPLALMTGALAAYVLRGNLPRSLLDWLPVVPLLGLAPALWAPYSVGPAGAALLYGLAPLAAAAAAVSLVGALRAVEDEGHATLFRVLTAGLWAADATILIARFGEPWMWHSLLVVASLFVLAGAVVPRLGPGRRRLRQRRHDTLGQLAGTVVALSALGVATVALGALAGQDVAAAVVAGIAALSGLVAGLCTLYLLFWLRLADPRATLRLRTGTITPAGAAEFVADTLGWTRATTRGIEPAPADARRLRMARVIWRLGRKVSPIADTNEPPFFKSLLTAELGDGVLTLRCWGVTGYADDKLSPSLEDCIAIPLDALTERRISDLPAVARP